MPTKTDRQLQTKTQMPMPPDVEATKARWVAKIAPLLVGRTIKQVRYMTDAEANEAMWNSAPLVIVLDNGQCLWPSSDDEGNDAGALQTTFKQMPTIPVI